MKKNSDNEIDVNDPTYRRMTEPFIITKDMESAFIKIFENPMTVEEFTKDVDCNEIKDGDIEKFVKGCFKNK